ncbi:MAG TPA: universal stress protein [Massilibacterium sp.]|nr:universal stress protein [Massilibacterium sp.]
MKRILFPTDFSNTSRKALTYALEIARRNNAELILTHTIEDIYEFTPMIEDYKQRMTREVEIQLQNLIDEITIKEEYQNLDVKTQILNGRIVTTILEKADQVKADLIVMGTTGATGLKKIFFGSNATEVMLKSAIPVLAVPEGSSFDGLKHITFFTDYHDGDKKALNKITELGKLFDSEITIVHIEEEHNFTNEIMRRGFKEMVAEQISIAADFEFITAESFLSGVSKFLDNNPSSLLTMVRYKKPFFTELFHKDHSKEMTFYSNIPLLILEGKK